MLIGPPDSGRFDALTISGALADHLHAEDVTADGGRPACAAD
ncbi:hypothetical protein ACIOEW_25605 [Streptomyces sp. NPDC087901]